MKTEDKLVVALLIPVYVIAIAAVIYVHTAIQPVLYESHEGKHEQQYMRAMQCDSEFASLMPEQ